MLTTEEQDAILKRARALARCHLDVKRRLLAMGLVPLSLIESITGVERKAPGFSPGM